MERTKPKEEMINKKVGAGENSNLSTIEAFETFGIVARWADATPGPLSFLAAAVNVANNTFTITSHGLATGTVFQLSTSGGLPAPLVVLTNYYAIIVDANTIKVASSLVNAIAGTAIDITTQGTGTHTLTATALANASIKLQETDDMSDANAWFDVVGSQQSISSSGNYAWEFETTCWPAIRGVVALDSGVLQVSFHITAKLVAGS